MTSELTLCPSRIGTLAAIADQASEFSHQAKARNTIRAYKADWSHFQAWCRVHGQASLPALPDVVALYVTSLAATHKPATIARRITAISQAHQTAGFDTPTTSSKVRMVLAGIRRAKGTAQEAKTPVLIEDLRKMVALLPDTLLGIRDRALLVLGFSCAFRRSEVVSLDLSDLALTRDGLTVTLRRSKTDQEGAGRKIGVPYGSTLATCPIRSVQQWMERSKISEGPLFRPINRHGKMASFRLSDGAVAEIVKRHAAAAGMDATDFAGHSLRSGFATSAAMKGASERSIQNQTGHRSLEMLRRYIRDGSLFRENAAAMVGL